MISLVTILIILGCIVLAFFILVQNPKGGGLSGTFGSIGTQVMGVKQSTDVMEKGTWSTMGVIAALCIISVMFYPSSREVQNTPPAPQSQSAPAPQQQPAAPAQQQQPAPNQ